MRPLLSFQKDTAQNEATGSQRWVVSYADFITLLFVLFLVLYARLPKQNTVDTPKVQPLHGQMIPGIRPRHVQLPIQAQAATPARSQQKQQVVWQELTHTLSELLQAGDVTMVTRDEGVLLEIRDTALFASGTAQPAAQAAGIIARIAEVLEKDSNLVTVEGHTDSMPIQNTQYPSNWELSSARAASVVRALQEKGIHPNRLTASGLADTKPISSNETTQGRSENRRVSLLILNSPN
ncbi:OmpA family protein [soil metagenome]